MAKKIKLPSGAEAEVVEHAAGEWFGRVPAALVDWDGTGDTKFALAETEALWAEQIARTSEQNRQNATRVTADDVKLAIDAVRIKLHRKPTMVDVADYMKCDQRTIRNALKAAGLSWKGL